MISSKEILNKFINFYRERGHKLIPNVSLVPEGDSTLLFVNSGMFPLVPYFSGQSHPLGKRLVNVQRSLRFEDLDEIGDTRHTLAFHMIGNWSLGDYFKKEQLPWAYEFLIEHLGIDPKRLYATVFEGDQYAPKDEEATDILKEIFKKYGIEAKENERIFSYGRKSNWWQRGDAVGELGGPDSEIYCYVGEGEPPVGKSPADYEEEFLEIGNSVFMQYKKTETGWEPLPQKNVDFGGGLERIALVAQQKRDIFETDNFWPIIDKVQEITGKSYNESNELKKGMRVLADHMRASVFLAMDGVSPSNKDQGYALRRILRRMVRAGNVLGSKRALSSSLVGTVCEEFSWLYPQLTEKREYIEKMFLDEETKFKKTLEKGAAQVSKLLTHSKERTQVEWAEKAFDLYQSLGYPSEIFFKDLADAGVSLNEKEFEKTVSDIFSKHQEGSRAGAEKKFKGGLADHSEDVIKYHTTTHLLQQALRQVLGTHVRQMGSNITNERLRFDFPNPRKLTRDEVSKVEELVNDVISKGLPVNFENMPKEEALKSGALFIPGESYPDIVKIYYVGTSIKDSFSKEFCGGPHVENTKVLSPIKIYKQENIGEGKLRVYVQFK